MHFFGIYYTIFIIKCHIIISSIVLFNYVLQIITLYIKHIMLYIGLLHKREIEETIVFMGYNFFTQTLKKNKWRFVEKVLPLHVSIFIQNMLKVSLGPHCAYFCMRTLKPQVAKVSAVCVEKIFAPALSILNTSTNLLCHRHLIGW